MMMMKQFKKQEPQQAVNAHILIMS